MLRISKTILWIAAVGAGAYLLICVAANLWLQSSRVQERLRDVASEALDIPVDVGRTYYLPWSGVTLRNIRAQSETPDTPKLTAHSLTLRIRLLPLLQKKVRIQEIRLDQPRLAWKQAADGTWKGFDHPPRIPDIIVPQQPVAETDMETEKPTAPPSFQVNVVKALIRDGEVVLSFADGKEFIAISGIDMETLVANEKVVSGNASIEKVQFSKRATLEKVRAPFHLENGLLTMDGLRAKWAGGKISGFAELRVTKPGIPFKSKLKLVDIELRDLLAEAGIPSGETEGALNGLAELRGTLMDVNDLEGTGFLDLHQGPHGDL